MRISKQARREAKGLFGSCLASGLLEESRVRRAVEHVMAKKPRGYLAILSHFHRLLKLEVARRTAKVESAEPTSPALQASIKHHLSDRYGPGLNISFSENPRLIGGLRIQVGSDVYDGSVQARLAALEESF